MRDILDKIQVHVPFRLLRERRLDWVLREGIQPEIAFNHLDLERYGEDEFRETGGRLADAGRSVTFHAPFMDLRPGAVDPAIRRITQDRLRRVCDLIPHFRPRTIVCHASYDERYYGPPEELWLENSLETWRTLLAGLAGSETRILLENVHERDPEPLRLLFEALASPRIRFCFDTGHANAFGGVSPEVWLNGLGGHLEEVHLHDNGGLADEHLPIGEGSFPFGALFTFLRTHRPQPILTVECHSEATLRRMLEELRAGRHLEGL